jgi:transposase
VHTSDEAQVVGERRRRRAHSDEFKADAVTAAARPGMSTASVALSLGINANLLRRWVREAEVSGGQVERAPVPAPVPPMPPDIEPGTKPVAFVPVQLPAPTPAPAPGKIQLEFRRGAISVAVTWPAGQAAECGAWLREILR